MAPQLHALPEFFGALLITKLYPKVFVGTRAATNGATKCRGMQAVARAGTLSTALTSFTKLRVLLLLINFILLHA